MLRRVLILAVAFITLLLGEVGCMASKPNVNEMALAVMEEKYGEKFEYYRPWGNSMTGTREFIARCESLPGQDIHVEIENFRDDGRIFRDTYLLVKYKPECTEFFKKCVADVFGEAVIFYDVTYFGLSPELTGDATFEEVLADPGTRLGIIAEIKESDFLYKGQAEEAANALAALCARFNFSLVVVEDGDYGTYDRDTLLQSMSSEEYVAFAAITWADGKLTIKW
ncbi:MAG: hypothetical protein LBV08_07280 [Clostridiales bacterium]|nr:hypothetical protein [Clostridiales bacterium]